MIRMIWFSCICIAYSSLICMLPTAIGTHFADADRYQAIKEQNDYLIKHGILRK